MTNVPPAPDGPPQPARALADVMRELAAASADGTVTVHADTVRAWADEIEALEARVAAFVEMYPAPFNDAPHPDAPPVDHLDDADFKRIKVGIPKPPPPQPA